MRTLEPIEVGHEALYRACVDQTQDGDKRNLLLALTNRVVASGVGYVAALEAGQAHTLAPVALADDEKTELRKVYNARLVSKTGVCRGVYDQIKMITTTCPLCGFGEIYEIDHYLPQSPFPELNVLTRNLFPICHPCNNIKLVKLPESAGRSFLHPYFDRLPDERWLYANIEIKDGGPVLDYRVALDEGVHGILAQRLGYHFVELELDRRMSERSSQILVELEADIDENLSVIGAEGIRNHFEEAGKRSFRRHGNILETAAYFAAAENEDYCAGMYKN